jgi:large subunit ribosomal protein L13
MATRNTTTIDATGKAIGRLASEIAMYLQGKHKADFERHVDKGDAVEVRNMTKVKITGKKAEQKEFFRYSGYPGGLKRTQLKTVMEKDPKKALEHAVYRMLPKNRLRKERMKRLKVHND